MFDKIKYVVSIILIIVLIPILFVAGVILVDSFINKEEVPSFFGWKPLIVLSGSMETQIFAGDVAVVKEVESEELKLNDIIAFRQNDIVITHRIVDIVEEGGTTKIITKGDNNNTEDSGFVTYEQIEGIYKFRIPRLGNVAMFIQTPTGMIACLSIPMALLLIIQAVQTRDERRKLKEKTKEKDDMKKEIEELKRELSKK